MEFLVFSDLHLCKFPHSNITDKGENELLITGLDIIDQVYNYAVGNNIKDIYFLGDLFHVRSKLDSEIYTNLVQSKFSEYFDAKDQPNLILLPGNHDQINKSGKHILLPYSKIKNITVIDDFYKKDNLIFCPHQYKNKVLYNYLKENSDENSFIFMHQLLVNSPTMANSIFRKNEGIDTSEFRFRYLFSGHNHRPFESSDDKIFNIGSPMHYDFGDAECQDRFFIHFKDDKISWVKTKFPHFAIHGTKDAETAPYVKKKSKKVKKLSVRTEINFNDDITNILEVYVNSMDVSASLIKEDLIKVGLNLLNEKN